MFALPSCPTIPIQGAGDEVRKDRWKRTNELRSLGERQARNIQSGGWRCRFRSHRTGCSVSASHHEVAGCRLQDRCGERLDLSVQESV
jgi:hypothetical protein